MCKQCDQIYGSKNKAQLLSLIKRVCARSAESYAFKHS